MIIVFILFVLLPFAVLGFVSYKISSTTLQQKISHQTVLTLSAMDRNLLASVSEVNSFSDYVISSSEIQSYLKTNDKTSIYEFYNKQQSIAGIMYGNSQIDDFILYSDNGSVVHMKNTPIPSFVELKSSSFFEQVMQQKGRPLWVTPSEPQPFLQRNSFLLTQGRVVKDINSLNDLGYLILNIKLDLFDEIFEDVLEGDRKSVV